MNLSAPRTCCFDSRTSTISSLAVDRRWKHTELNDEVWNHALGYLMCVSVWYLQHVQWQLVGRRVRTLQRQKQTGLNTQTHTQRNANTHWTQSLSSQCDNKWCSSWVHQVSSLQIIYNHQEMKTVLSFFCVLLVMKTSNINKLNDLKVVSLSSQTVLYYSRNMETILTLHHQEGGDDDWASLSGWTLLILVRRVRTSLNPESRVIWFWSSFRCELTSGLESLRTWYCRNWCSM